MSTKRNPQTIDAGEHGEYGRHWPDRPVTTHAQDAERERFEAALERLRASDLDKPKA